MPQATVGTANIMCSFGTAPAALNVIRPTITVEGKPLANIQDMAPMANIPTFGMCTTPSNPAVASATAAALGVLTPMPCVPVTVAPWAPGGSTVMVQGMPVLNNASTCNCAYGGVITIAFAGTTKTLVP